MSGEYLATCRSEITACTQTDLTPCRDDDVVMQGKTQRFAARLDLLRHLQVGIRRFGITTGVIAEKDLLVGARLWRLAGATDAGLTM